VCSLKEAQRRGPASRASQDTAIQLNHQPREAGIAVARGGFVISNDTRVDFMIPQPQNLAKREPNSAIPPLHRPNKIGL
jgi:hypothetical protein